MIFPGFGFIYIGLKSSNRNWILEGVTYELPFFFYLLAAMVFPVDIIFRYYFLIIILAVLIALLRSIMVAIKLFDVYDLDETPIVTKVSASDNSSSRVSNTVSKVKDKDSHLSECCCCVIVIFIVFALISIL